MTGRRLTICAALVLLVCGFAAAQCPASSSNTSNFNGTPIHGGAFIWFNANMSVKGIPSSGATISLSSPSISFTADQPYNVAVPGAQITFDPNAVCASTTFDTQNNIWNTTVPVTGSDEIFLTGLAFPVPDSFANAGGLVKGPVTWQGAFTATADVTISWKWGAAIYTHFSTDYNLLGVKPTHSNTCLYPNSDHAGTPEGVDPSTGVAFKNFVTGGARGGGGSNWTGSWSGTASISVSCSGVPQ